MNEEEKGEAKTSCPPSGKSGWLLECPQSSLVSLPFYHPAHSGDSQVGRWRLTSEVCTFPSPRRHRWGHTIPSAQALSGRTPFPLCLEAASPSSHGTEENSPITERPLPAEHLAHWSSQSELQGRGPR